MNHVDVGLFDSMYLQGSIEEMVEMPPSIFDDEDREDQQSEAYSVVNFGQNSTSISMIV